MPIRPLTSRCEEFESTAVGLEQAVKTAGLLTVPESFLRRAQQEVLGRFCSLALQRIDHLLRQMQLARFQGTDANQDDSQIHAIRQVRDICLTYGAVTKPTDASFTLTMTVDRNKPEPAARYINRLPESKLEVTIHMTVVTSPQQMSGIIAQHGMQEQSVEGLYTPEGLYFYVDLPRLERSITDPQEFLTYLAAVRNTVRHESQHALQMSGWEASGQTHLLGFPPNRERDDQPGGTQHQHSIRDVEFQTDLADSIQDFRLHCSRVNQLMGESNGYLNGQLRRVESEQQLPHRTDLQDLMLRIEPQVRRVLFQVWVGESGGLAGKRAIEQLVIGRVFGPILSNERLRQAISQTLMSHTGDNRFLAITDFPAIYQRNPFLPELRAANPAKYRRAIREAYRAVSNLF